MFNGGIIMKSKKGNSKLRIAKQMISNLSNKEMLKVKGGIDPSATYNSMNG
jgi:hypothetical protein